MDAEIPLGPAQAESGKLYRCPECLAPVRVRHGAVRRWHFFHATDAGNCGFGGESCQHVLAKHLIYWAVIDWRRNSGPVPKLIRECRRKHQISSALSDQVHDAAIECRVGQLGHGSIIPDVLLLDHSGKAHAGIEIWYKHQVDEEKAVRAGDLHLIELRADEVLDDPLVWRVVGETGTSVPWVCAECGPLDQQEEEARQHAAKVRAAKRETQRREEARSAEREERRRLEDLRRRSKALKLRVHWRNAKNVPSNYGMVLRDQKVPQVDGCPLQQRYYMDHHYANVEADCSDCQFQYDIQQHWDTRKRRDYPELVFCEANQLSEADLASERARVRSERDESNKRKAEAWADQAKPLPASPPGPPVFEKALIPYLSRTDRPAETANPPEPTRSPTGPIALHVVPSSTRHEGKAPITEYRVKCPLRLGKSDQTVLVLEACPRCESKYEIVSPSDQPMIVWCNGHANCKEWC